MSLVDVYSKNGCSQELFQGANFLFFIYSVIPAIFHAYALLCTLYRFSLSLLPLYGGASLVLSLIFLGL